MKTNLWLIEDIEAFNIDSQYAGFVVLNNIDIEVAFDIAKTVISSGKSALFMPIKE